jgi:hypothetical protein
MTPLTKVNVEHCCVCPLDEDGLSHGDLRVQIGDGLDHHRPHALGKLAVPRQLGLLVHVDARVAGGKAVGQSAEPKEQRKCKRSINATG